MSGTSLSVQLQFPLKVIPLKRQYSGSEDLTAGKTCYKRKLSVTINDGGGNITRPYTARLVYSSAKREPDYIRISSRLEDVKINLSLSGEPQDILLTQIANVNCNELPF